MDHESDKEKFHRKRVVAAVVVLSVAAIVAVGVVVRPDPAPVEVSAADAPTNAVEIPVPAVTGSDLSPTTLSPSSSTTSAASSSTSSTTRPKSTTTSSAPASSSTTTTTAGRVPPSLLGRIVFASSPDGPGGIWVMDADGANRRNITPTPGIVPDLSPDGRRIVFNTGLGGGGLAIVDSDGANLRILVPTISVYTPPKWSPDGRRILYSDGHTLRTINPDGTGDRVIFTPAKTPYNDGLSLFGASWAPDGLRVVATSLGASSADGLWILDLDTQTATHVYTGRAHEVAWSPLGDRIAVSSGPNDDIFTVRPDGTDRQQLTGLPGQFDGSVDTMDPAWSPDGTRIAFSLSRYVDSGEVNRTVVISEVWDIGVDGSGLRNLTHNAGQDRQPTF